MINQGAHSAGQAYRQCQWQILTSSTALSWSELVLTGYGGNFLLSVTYEFLALPASPRGLPRLRTCPRAHHGAYLCPGWQLPRQDLPGRASSPSKRASSEWDVLPPSTVQHVQVSALAQTGARFYSERPVVGPLRC